MYDIPTEIRFDEVVLRPLDITLDLARRIYELFEADRVGTRYWLAGQSYVSPEQLLVRYYNRPMMRLRGYMYGIFVDGELVGEIGLTQVNNNDDIGHIGYWITPSVRGRGIIARAMPYIERIGFENLNLATLFVECDAQNDASRRVATRAGYTLDGIQRSVRLWSDGSRHDRCIYSKLKSEWEKENKNA